MRRASLLLAAVLGACATVPPPLVVEVRSGQSLRELHQCVTEQLVDAGYAITETRRDDGVIEARRYRPRPRTTFYGGRTEYYDEVHVLIFERASGVTSIQLRADTWKDGGGRVGPSERVSRLPGELRAACR